MTTLVLVEDDPDVRALVRALFARDPRFHIAAESASVADALSSIQDLADDVELIVLDHSLEGDMSGLDAAPLLKAAAPAAKILLFTAYENLQDRVESEPTIDALLLKTRVFELVPLAQTLTGLAA